MTMNMHIISGFYTVKKGYQHLKNSALSKRQCYVFGNVRKT